MLRYLVICSSILLLTTSTILGDEVIKIDVVELSKDVESRFDKKTIAKYAGKTLEITGEVFLVSQEYDGPDKWHASAVLAQLTPRFVRCSVPLLMKDSDSYRKMARGGKVTLRGKAEDKPNWGLVIANCEIVSYEGTSPIVVEWSKFDEQLKKLPKFPKRHETPTFIVQTAVKQVERLDDQDNFKVTFALNGVSAEWDVKSIESDKIANLKPGDRVELACFASLSQSGTMPFHLENVWVVKKLTAKEVSDKKAKDSGRPR